MSDSVLRELHEPFRPRARLLQLLGDELIGSARLAVFELVKNAYDADANKVVVSIDLASGDEPGITIEDDGEGMTLDVLRSVWLIPGNDHRQRHNASPTRGLRSISVFRSERKAWAGSLSTSSGITSAW